VLTPNVMLASIKKAEDSDALIVRVYEVEGKDTEAKVRLTDLVSPGTPARQVDLMEQPIPKLKAKMEGDTLIVKVPAFGIASVMVG
jgi:alpha-mannosidase